MPPFDEPSAAALAALRCLDLTSLRDDDSAAGITALATRAATPHGAPAALCVYPRWVGTARRALDAQGLRQVRIATVVNFPHGRGTPQAVAREVADALALGADEIDAVHAWPALLAGDAAAGAAVVQAARRACDAVRPGVVLKVILETGELREAARIRQAADCAIAAGADFLKTSTGKVPVHATPAAVAVLLQAIVDHGGGIGLKVAGGLASLADVQGYLAQAAQACGEGWVTPQRLRFGASSLLPVLLQALEGGTAPAGVGQPGASGAAY